MRSYYLSKPIEIFISRTFKDSEEVSSAKIIDILCNIVTKTAEVNDEIIYEEVILLLKELKHLKLKPQIISRTHLLDTANGIAHREWIYKISFFHIITGLCIILNHKTDTVTKFVDSQIMFTPPISDYLDRDSIIQNALNVPIHSDKERINEISASLVMYQNVAIVGE